MLVLQTHNTHELMYLVGHHCSSIPRLLHHT